MTMIGRWLLLGALAAPLLSLGAMTWLRARPSTGARVSAALQWVGAVMAGLLTTVVAIHGTVAVSIGSSGGVVFGLTANRLTVVLIVPVPAALVQTSV